MLKELTKEQDDFLKELYYKSLTKNNYYISVDTDDFIIDSSCTLYSSKMLNVTEEQQKLNDKYFNLIINLFDIKFNVYDSNTKKDKSLYLELNLCGAKKIYTRIEGTLFSGKNKRSYIKIENKTYINDFLNFIRSNNLDYNDFDYEIKNKFKMFDIKEEKLKSELNECIETKNNFIKLLNLPIEFI